MCPGEAFGPESKPGSLSGRPGVGGGACLSLVMWYQGSRPDNLAAVGVVRTPV